MATAVSLILTIIAVLLAVPVMVLLVEILAAVALPRRRLPTAPAARRPRLAVLVPAHDEGGALRPTLEDAAAQLERGDRLLVVADNCTDDTAAHARAAGAETIERHDPTRRGKGFALDFGVRHLARDRPEVVVVVDADCRLGAGALTRLAGECAAAQRPAQALYLMEAPPGAPLSTQVAAFAWRVKNQVRPLGLKALGLPCQLMGTGMAFPFDLIRTADLATGDIVEDLSLGLALAAGGHAPLLCPEAAVTSVFPATAGGAESQRRRWEGGHLRLIGRLAPPLLRRATVRRDPKLLALALDLAVPPLALLGLMLLAAFVATGFAALAGVATLAFVLSATSLAAFALALMLAWLSHGRDVLPPRAFVAIPGFVARKLGFYRRLLARRPSGDGWVRTERGTSAAIPKKDGGGTGQ